MGRKDKDRSGEASVNGSTHKEKEKEREKEKELPGRPSGSSGGPAFGATQSSGSSSFFNVPSNTATPHADDASATLHPDDSPSPRRSHSPARSKNLPPIPRDFAAAVAGGALATTPQQPAGEVNDREVFESVGQNTLSVRFEINIIKVLSSFFHIVNPCLGSDYLLLFSLGSMVAVTWPPISSCGRRWMAVPDACTTSPDGVEALT